MADSGQQSLRIPHPLPSWAELNRRCATHSEDVLQRLETIEREYLKIVDALAVFSFAGYGGLVAEPEIAMANLGLGWQTVPFNGSSVVTPRSISVDVANDTMSFLVDGVFCLAITGTIEHNEQNQGRETYLRFYNVTDATPAGNPFRMFTGRNTSGTPVSWVFLAEVDESNKNKVWRIEMGGGDSYSTVDWGGEWGAFNVGEWREPLGGIQL